MVCKNLATKTLVTIIFVTNFCKVLVYNNFSQKNAQVTFLRIALFEYISKDQIKLHTLRKLKEKKKMKWG